MPDASGIETTLGELPPARTVQTEASAPQMRTHIAGRMQHVFLNCMMLVGMGCGIGKLRTHNTVNSVCRQHPISQNQQHVNMW